MIRPDSLWWVKSPPQFFHRTGLSDGDLYIMLYVEPFDSREARNERAAHLKKRGRVVHLTTDSVPSGQVDSKNRPLGKVVWEIRWYD